MFTELFNMDRMFIATGEKSASWSTLSSHRDLMTACQVSTFLSDALLVIGRLLTSEADQYSPLESFLIFVVIITW